MFLLWLRQLPWCGDQTPASNPPPTKGRSSPTNTPVFPLVPLSYWILCGSVYFPVLSGTPLCSQLVFCMHFCLWSCIPDVFMERDVSTSTYSSIILFQYQLFLFISWLLNNSHSMSSLYYMCGLLEDIRLCPFLLKLTGEYPINSLLKC